LYNLKLALATCYGLFVVKSPSVVIATLFIYLFAGVVLIYSSPRMWKGFIIQSLPALLGLYLFFGHVEDLFTRFMQCV
jgi:hypothetical protein